MGYVVRRSSSRGGEEKGVSAAEERGVIRVKIESKGPVPFYSAGADDHVCC